MNIERLQQTAKYYRRRNVQGLLEKHKIDALTSLGFIWNLPDSWWNKWYEKLVLYKQAHGHCNVSLRDGLLGSWVGNQRTHRRNQVLPQDRINKLDAIGFVWEQLEDNWKKMYGALVQYKETHEHCNVSILDKKHKPLGLWVSHQRDAYQKQYLPKERVDLLIAIGFEWNPAETRWNKMYGELKRYFDLHGNSNASKEKDGSLGMWVSTQRRLRQTLSQERIDLLNKLDFVWDLIEAKWMGKYNELCEYKKKYGTCDVSLTHNKRLNGWLAHQREYHNIKSKKITEAHIDLLNKIGVSWNVFDDRWDKMYNKLIEYCKKHGDCDVLASAGELGHWVSHQRTNLKKGILADDQIKRLDALGFIWDSDEYYWNKYYKQLCEFKSKHGHCLVNTETSGSFGRWIGSQRQHYRNKRIITKEQIDLLNAIGFDWEPQGNRWDRRYEELRNFQQKNGNCLVRQQQNKPLWIWIKTQRKSYEMMKRLFPERIVLLDKIGFVWNENEADWKSKYQELIEYKNIRGDCNASITDKQYRQLGMWVCHQRSYYRQKKLSQDRINKLNELGFEWEVDRGDIASKIYAGYSDAKKKVMSAKISESLKQAYASGLRK